MSEKLPKDLAEAESQIHSCISQFIKSNPADRISINLKLEGLRLMPLVIRFFNNLKQDNIKSILLWPDAGATALAKRDAPEIADYIKSFKDIKKLNYSEFTDYVFIATSPQHYDYEEFESLCTSNPNKIIMINGKLDDSSVGIGSVARKRRKLFISKWQNIYWLEPIQNGALMHSYPADWSLFRSDSDGYRFVKEFNEKPNDELIFESLI